MAPLPPAAPVAAVAASASASAHTRRARSASAGTMSAGTGVIHLARSSSSGAVINEVTFLRESVCRSKTNRFSCTQSAGGAAYSSAPRVAGCLEPQ